MPPIVLASTSSYRRELLARLCVPFTCDRPGVDEDVVKHALRDPLAIVQELARQKARAVAARHLEAIVIGSDQAAVLGDDILDKPGSTERAIAQLGRLQGRAHRLLTAVAIVHPGGIAEFVDTTTLHMRTLSAAEIERYVHTERPLDCAGSYQIEKLGITLFDHIDGGDQTAIIGLPLLRLCHELRRLGVPLP